MLCDFQLRSAPDKVVRPIQLIPISKSTVGSAYPRKGRCMTLVRKRVALIERAKHSEDDTRKVQEFAFVFNLLYWPQLVRNVKENPTFSTFGPRYDENNAYHVLLD